jgi:hypothetical protein
VTLYSFCTRRVSVCFTLISTNYKSGLGVEAILQSFSAQDGACPALACPSAGGMRELLVYDSTSLRLVEGYLMYGRTYQSDTSLYKYTGKERDIESTYDYFVYDSTSRRLVEVQGIMPALRSAAKEGQQDRKMGRGG